MDVEYTGLREFLGHTAPKLPVQILWPTPHHFAAHLKLSRSSSAVHCHPCKESATAPGVVARGDGSKVLGLRETDPGSRSLCDGVHPVSSGR